MPKPRHPLKEIEEEYSRYAILKELELLHSRINDLYLASTDSNLSTSYVAGDLGTAAEIATAINATNTKINLILAKIRRDT
jgi:hypothetical protein